MKKLLEMFIRWSNKKFLWTNIKSQIPFFGGRGIDPPNPPPPLYTSLFQSE